MDESLRQPLSNIMPITRIDNFDPIAAFHSLKIKCNDICTFIENTIRSLHDKYQASPKTNINPWGYSSRASKAETFHNPERLPWTNPYKLEAAENYNIAHGLAASPFMQMPAFSDYEMLKLFTVAEWADDYECLNCCWEMKECYLALENLDKKHDSDDHVEYKEAIDKVELAFKKLKVNVELIEFPADIQDLWKGYNLFKMLRCHIVRGI